MHGTGYANKAVMECDLLLNIGSRWDDRIVGRLDEFCKDAVKIHIDIDDAEYGKMIKPDYFCIGDAKLVVAELNKHISKLDIQPWVDKCAQFKVDFPLQWEKVAPNLLCKKFS